MYSTSMILGDMTQHLSLNMFREMFFKVEDRRTSLSSIQFYSYNAKSPTEQALGERNTQCITGNLEAKTYSSVTKGAFRVP